MSRRDQDRSRKRQPGTLGYVPTQPRSKSRPGHGRTSQYSKYFSKRREHERQERERVVGHRKEEDRVSSGDRDSDARSADKNRRASLGSDGRNSPKASYDRRDSRYGRSMSRDRREKSFDVEDPIDAPNEDLGRARDGSEDSKGSRLDYRDRNDSARSRHDSRDRNGSARGRYDSRDRNGSGRSRHDSRDRNGSGRSRHDSRDRNGSARSRHDSRDRNDSGKHRVDSRDRHVSSQSRHNSRDRDGSGRNRNDSRDRNASGRSRYDSRDRESSSRSRHDSRDRRGSHDDRRDSRDRNQSSKSRNRSLDGYRSSQGRTRSSGYSRGNSRDRKDDSRDRADDYRRRGDDSRRGSRTEEQEGSNDSRNNPSPTPSKFKGDWGFGRPDSTQSYDDRYEIQPSSRDGFDKKRSADFKGPRRDSTHNRRSGSRRTPPSRGSRPDSYDNRDHRSVSKYHVGNFDDNKYRSTRGRDMPTVS